MKTIYIDLDGVVADFDKGKIEHPCTSSYQSGIFSSKLSK